MDSYAAIGQWSCGWLLIGCLYGIDSDFMPKPSLLKKAV